MGIGVVGNYGLKRRQGLNLNGGLTERKGKRFTEWRCYSTFWELD